VANMAKLTCKVPDSLNTVVKKAHARFEGKTKALKYLVRLATEDGKDRKDWLTNPPFGKSQDVSCTLSMSKAEYEATLPYRTKYALAGKNEFFAFVLQHGGKLYQRCLESGGGTESPSTAPEAESP